MNHPSDRTVRAYVETKIRTAPPALLVDELLQACLRRVEDLQLALHSMSVEEQTVAAEAALEILSVLNDGLDEPLSSFGQALRSLYAECACGLVRGCLRRDAAQLDEVQGILSELRGAWIMTLPQG
ncbi:MAG: flagellar protein FliS [Myxococcota bacterium]